MTHARDRRRLIAACLALPALAVLPRGRLLAATPACGAATPAQTAGPFFLPRSPERTRLAEPGAPGRPLRLAGRVLDRRCMPVAGAVLDVWQADGAGRYDTGGYRLRGHQRAGPDGAWRLETVRPADYAGRTAHIHVRVHGPDGRALTTQLYFPDAPRNGADRLFRPDLLVAWTGEGEGRFDFVLDV